MGRLSFNPEDVVEKSLQILKDKHFIAEFIRSPKNDFYDKEGMDFIIILEQEGIALLLQVTGDKDCVKRHYVNHPHIRWVMVVDRNRPSFVAKKIKQKIIYTLKQLRNNNSIPNLNSGRFEPAPTSS